MGLLDQYKPESKFLKAEDLTQGEITLTIKTVIETTFNDGRKAPALLFHEIQKEFGLNQTNLEKLAELFGRWDANAGKMDVGVEDLVNQKICCYRASTKNPQGATVPCIRIRAPRIEANIQAPPQTQPHSAPMQRPAAPADYRPQGMAAPNPASQQREYAQQLAAQMQPADDDSDPFADDDPGAMTPDELAALPSGALPGMTAPVVNTAHA